jgi:hypothetical protein
MSKKAISHLYTISHVILGSVFFYIGCSAFGIVEISFPILETTVTLLACFAIINGFYFFILRKEKGYNDALSKKCYVSENVFLLVFLICLFIVSNCSFIEHPRVDKLRKMFLFAPTFYAAWLCMHVDTIEYIFGLRKDKDKTQKTTNFTHCQCVKESENS